VAVGRLTGMGAGPDRHATGIDSGLWLVPVVGIGGAIMAVVGFGIFLAGAGGGTASLGVMLGGIGGLVVQVCILGSGVTSYREAQALEAAGADWVPTGWAYLVGTLLLGPLVMAVYVMRRLRSTNVSLSRS